MGQNPLRPWLETHIPSSAIQTGTVGVPGFWPITVGCPCSTAQPRWFPSEEQRRKTIFWFFPTKEEWILFMAWLLMICWWFVDDLLMSSLLMICSADPMIFNKPLGFRHGRFDGSWTILQLLGLRHIWKVVKLGPCNPIRPWEIPCLSLFFLWVNYSLWD